MAREAAMDGFLPWRASSGPKNLLAAEGSAGMNGRFCGIVKIDVDIV